MVQRMNKKPQARPKHSDESIQQELNPNQMTTQNIGLYSIGSAMGKRYASEYKELINMFKNEFEMAELDQIPIVPVGTRLKAGAVYLNLKDPRREPFHAYEKICVEVGQYYVPKSEVDYTLWNRLLGITDLERTGKKAG